MRSGLIESLEPRMLFAGVILEATGRLGGTDGWMQSMADEITSRLGGPSQVPQFILTVDSDPSNGNLVASIAQVSGTPTPQENSSGEMIVLLNYYDISANPSYSSQYIGSVIANYFTTTPVDGVLLASMPIDELGVSRGASILDSVNLALGQSGVWVDQETYLDPDPIAAQGDAPSTVYDNVAFSDDYWRNDGSQAQTNDGNPVDGAYNLNVYWLDSEDSGYSTPHLAPAGYYIGTIDQNATYSGEGPIYSEWYGDTPTMPARDATGFIYTNLVGAARPLSGVWAASGGTGTRTATGQVGTQWGNLTDLAVTSSSTVAVGNLMNVDFIRQDRGSADTVTFYLDSDRNPYNGNFAANLGSFNLAQANAITQGSEQLSTAGVAPGTYWLCAEVTNAQGDTRYTYESVTAPVTVEASASITGKAFNDLNANGVQDSGEPGLAGRTVYIDLDGSGQYESTDPSTITDANGDYTISGLLPGTYSVSEVVPDGLLETTASSVSVTVAAGGTAVANFGTTQSAIISGTVALDDVPSTASDDSPSGFEVTLTEHPKHGKTKKLITTTNSLGGFSFAALEPGVTDTVKILKRKGFKLARHTHGTYEIKTADGQAISALLFSEIPIG
jgi:hypothetical protein